MRSRRPICAYRSTAEDLKAGRDETALATWNAVASAIPDHGDDRMWFLLAKHRASEVESERQARSETAHTWFVQAKVAEQSGQTAEAARIRREILGRFGTYESLRALVAQTRAALATEPADAPATESPAP